MYFISVGLFIFMKSIWCYTFGMKDTPKKKPSRKEPTTREIQKDVHNVLVAVNKFATHVEKRFDAVEGDIRSLKEEFGGLKEEFGGLKEEFGGLKEEFGGLKEDVGFLKRNMVTKIYLDEKIGDLRGDITELVHKEDRKFVALIHLLEDKDVLSEEDAVNILNMPPFPLSRQLG